jgi:hypothetical protein
MAMGTNIGLTKMAEVTPDISYRQMAIVMQWRLHEDAMIPILFYFNFPLKLHDHFSTVIVKLPFNPKLIG